MDVGSVFSKGCLLHSPYAPQIVLWRGREGGRRGGGREGGREEWEEGGREGGGGEGGRE